MSSDAADRGETFSLPAGTVTFLLSEVAGPVGDCEEDPQAMVKALARHDDLLADAVGRHGGVRPVGQGEGNTAIAAFSRASDALAAAVELQVALRVEPWPSGAAVTVRIGLHTGEAQLRDDGNYFGQAVNRCARLRALAHGGQVVVSRPVHDLVADRLPAGVELRDLGSHRLRDLGRPEHVFQVVHPGLRDDFPPLLSLDAVANNLPLQLTTFVGRDRELQELRRLMDGERIVTLTGSGGCGKTRLALQAAVERLDRHPDGVWFVELAPMGDATSVARVVAAALRIAEEPDRPLTFTLADRLHDRDLLVVFDNCEHVLTEVASLADTLLRSCPRLRLVATSRQPLNVAGEAPWRVPSLDLPLAGDDEPEPVHALEKYDAVRLFVDRATRARSNFRLTRRNVAAVVHLCRRVDGIPLAIELAAARTRTLTPHQILRGLDDRFRLLTGGAGTLLPRQQTLRASVDWSHDLLDERERTLFRRLSTFAGGFTLDAAKAVCTGEGLDESDILDVLSNLVDRSLVLLDDTGCEPRFVILETIREYGRERLEAVGEDVQFRDRHLDHFATLAGEAAPSLLTGEQA
ncbi:MAG TPA: AAA family ATPase, partial [Acidimicrobiales bacterium]|nr:AAA family ATPase [Acidimicrobiales bacterium]